MKIGWFISMILTTVGFALIGVATAQDTVTKTDHALKSFADSLRSHGIEISKQALTIALSNNDPEVRALAANQLAQDHDSDAIPSIEQALSNEKDSRTRVEISSALWALGDSKGANELQAMCSTASLPIAVTIEAVQNLQMVHLSTSGCVTTVLESLKKVESIDYRADILSLFPAMYIDSTDNQAGQIVSVSENLLSDTTQQPAVRMSASHVLAQIKSSSSAAVVRSALLRESDPIVQASLKEDLKVLEKQQ